MTMQEACELAQAIEGNGQFAVIAIGRFVMTDELSSLSKQTLRWNVSVVSLSDRQDRTVISSEAQWQAFAKATSKAKTRPATKSDEKPTLSKAEENQLELF